MKKLLWSLLCVSLVVLVSCSEEDSEKVNISFSPENPRVQFYDLPLTVYTNTDGDPQIEKIKAPWFRIKMNVANGASKNVVISNFNIKLKGVNSNQGFSAGDISIDPSALFVNKNKDEGDNKTVMEEVPTSSSLPIPSYVGNDDLDYIYVSGLPADVTTGVFNVEVEAVGWFGTTTNPTSVFRQKYYFTTD